MSQSVSPGATRTPGTAGTAGAATASGPTATRSGSRNPASTWGPDDPWPAATTGEATPPAITAPPSTRSALRTAAGMPRRGVASPRSASRVTTVVTTHSQQVAVATAAAQPHTRAVSKDSPGPACATESDQVTSPVAPTVAAHQTATQR